MRKITKLFSLLPILSSTVPLLTSCRSSNIIIANFESYMSSDLIDRVETEFDDRGEFLYYGTNEDIDRKFQSNYDIATPSSYQAISMYQRGWLQKLDWTKFGLHDPDDATKKITNGKEALNLFTEPVQEIIKTWSQDLFTDPNENLLDYCIPYFLQTWVFAYKGQGQVEGLSNHDSWNKVINKISNKSHNAEARFKNQRLACVDDNRSLYGISHLLEDEINHPNNQDDWTINPEEGATSQDYKNTYATLCNAFTQDSFWLNSDSGSVLNAFSDPNGMIGAFAYNGDILYAAQGAGTYPDIYTSENMHCVTPDKTLFALDMMVVNKNETPERMDLIYQMLKYMLLDGVDDYNEAIAVYPEEDENAGEYKHGPMLNFADIQYTDVFKTIDKNVNPGDQETLYSDDSYFGSYVGESGIDDFTGWEKNEGETQEHFEKRITEQKKKVDLYLDIYLVPTPTTEQIQGGFYKKVIERPINFFEKSNMYGAYVETIREGL